MIRKTNKWVAVMTAGALILTSINIHLTKVRGMRPQHMGLIIQE